MKKRKVIKLNEDDILEILIEHFQTNNKVENAKGILFGESGKDLRFVGVFGSINDIDIGRIDLGEVDKDMEFNGDHR